MSARRTVPSLEEWLSAKLTTTDITAGYANPEWGGFGYLGERRHTRPAALRRAIDELVVDVAYEFGWNRDQFFGWLNSRHGRKFAEYAHFLGSIEAVAGSWEALRLLALWEREPEFQGDDPDLRADWLTEAARVRERLGVKLGRSRDPWMATSFQRDPTAADARPAR